MANKRIHGKHGQIAIDQTGVMTTFTPVASINGFTIDMATDTAEVTAFGDPNKVYVVGLPDLKGTVKGWWDSLDVTLVTIAMAGTKVGMQLIPDVVGAPTFLWKGLAYLSASIDVASNGAASLSGNYVAADAWTRMP